MQFAHSNTKGFLVSILERILNPSKKTSAIFLSFVLTLFWMGFLMYHSKIFKNDPKKLKLTLKLEHIKIFPKQKEKICSDLYF